MNVLLGDLSLLDLLKKARENRSIISPKITLSQVFTLKQCETPEGAVERMMSGIITWANTMPEQYIDPSVPLINAIAMLLKHPAAKPEMLTGIVEDRRERMEMAVKAVKDPKWDVGTFEWQLVIEVLVLGGDTPVDLNRTLAQQEFEDQKLQHAWNVLMDLSLLQMENRLS